MIQRPTHLDYHKTKLEFNGQVFSELELDLNHINKDDRSDFGLKEIEKILKTMIDGKIYSPAGEKQFGDESCTYYMIRKTYKDHPYKLVICICSDKPSTIGVITFYREDI